METLLKTNAAIVNVIFKGPETGHGLKVFAPSEIDRLKLTEEGGKAFIECLVRQKRQLAKPEEIIRQLMLYNW